MIDPLLPLFPIHGQTLHRNLISACVHLRIRWHYQRVTSPRVHHMKRACRPFEDADVINSKFGQKEMPQSRQTSLSGSLAVGRMCR